MANNEIRFQITAQAAQAQAEIRRTVLEIARMGGASEEAAQRAADSAQRLLASYQTAATGLGRLQNQIKDGTSAYAANVGNIAAQFQDIGVMVAAGQSPLVTAIQQGSQLSMVLGGQGAAGAARMLVSAFKSLFSPVTFLTIGVVALVSALSQWAIGAFQSEEETRTLSDTVDRLSEALREFSSASDDAVVSTFELVSRYGSLADEARRALEAIRDLRREEAAAQLDASARALGLPRGDLDNLIARRNAIEEGLAGGDRSRQDYSGTLEDVRDLSNAIRNLNDELYGVARAYGVTLDQAKALSIANEEFLNALPGQEKAEAADRLLQLMISIFGTIEQANAATNGMASELARLVSLSVDLAAELQGLPGSVGSLNSNLQVAATQMASLVQSATAVGPALSTAVSSAGALGDSLWNAAGAAWSVAQGIAAAALARGSFADRMSRANRQEAEVYSGRGLIWNESQLETGGTSLDTLLMRQGLQSLINRAQDPGGGGGGGGGSFGRSELNELREQAEKILLNLSTLSQGVDERVRLGLVGASEGAEEVGQATDRAANSLAAILPQLRALGTEGEASARQFEMTLREELIPAIQDVGDELKTQLSDKFRDSWVEAMSTGKGGFASFVNFLKRKALEIAYDRILGPLLDPLFGSLSSAIGSIGFSGARAGLTGTPSLRSGVSLTSAAPTLGLTTLTGITGASALSGASSMTPVIKIENPNPSLYKPSVTSSSESGEDVTSVVFERIGGLVASDIQQNGPVAQAISSAFGVRRQGR